MTLELKRLLPLQRSIGRELEQYCSNYKKAPTARKTGEFVKERYLAITSLWDVFKQNNQRMQVDMESYKGTKYHQMGYFDQVENLVTQVLLKINADARGMDIALIKNSEEENKWFQQWKTSKKLNDSAFNVEMTAVDSNTCEILEEDDYMEAIETPSRASSSENTALTASGQPNQSPKEPPPAPPTAVYNARSQLASRYNDEPKRNTQAAEQDCNVQGQQGRCQEEAPAERWFSRTDEESRWNTQSAEQGRNFQGQQGKRQERAPAER